MERDKLIARLMADGVPEDKAGILADEILAMAAPVKVEIEGADMKSADMGKMDPAMDAVRKAADARVVAAERAAAAKVKAAEDGAKAAVAAAEKRAQDAEVARAAASVRRAADSLQIGEGADVVKVAEQVADKLLVPHRGQAAVAFAEGVGMSIKPAKSTAADGAWKMTEEKSKANDGAEDSEPTPSSMEC